MLGSMKESHAQRCPLWLIDYSGKPAFYKSQYGMCSAQPAVAIMQLRRLLRTNQHTRFQLLRQQKQESLKKREWPKQPTLSLGTPERGKLSYNNAHTITCKLIAFPSVDYCRLSIDSGVYSSNPSSAAVGLIQL